jgi:hypothetical protein
MRRVRWVIAVALTVPVLAACGSHEPASTEGNADTVPETSGPSASGATEGSVSSLMSRLEGAWSTPTMSKDDLAAAARAADCPRELIATGFADWPDDRTAVYTLEFDDGSLTESESFDGGAPEVGSSGTYEVVDEHTLALIDDVDETELMFDYVLDGDVLTLRVASITCTEKGDPAPFYIYQGAPFERVS